MVSLMHRSAASPESIARSSLPADGALLVVCVLRGMTTVVLNQNAACPVSRKKKNE